MGDVINLEEFRKKRERKNKAAERRGSREESLPEGPCEKNSKERSGVAAGDIPEDEPA